MPRIARQMSRHRHKKCSVLRFIVIILSLISLLSRIIYCTYASWLVFTTFDCIPCSNTTASNDSSELFISHHSSAIFNAFRGFNIKSTESHSKARVKRSNGTEVVDNYSRYFSDNYYEIKEKAENLAKEAFKKIALEWSVIYNQSKPEGSRYETTTKLLESNTDRFVWEESLQNHSYQSNASFFDDEPQNQDQFYDKYQQKDGSEDVFIREEPKGEQNLNDKTSSNNGWPQEFAYVLEDEDIKDENLSNTTILSDQYDNYNNMSNISVIELENQSEKNLNETQTEMFGENDLQGMTMTILFNEQELNESTNSLKNLGSKRLEKSSNDNQLVNDTSYEMNNLTKKQMNDCSEECAIFLSAELNDPKIRKWAMILITSVMYLYALVMFCIFIGACFSLVDILITATFIEGAKLFAGFILLIIDSFNGKQVHFNLIDVKFNVNTKGNGWTVDFSYSEYLLDIIIFLLSTFLCISVFKCFNRRCKKISSIEHFQTRGTYRERNSSTSRVFHQKS